MEISQLGQTSLFTSRVGFGCGTGAGLMCGDDFDLQKEVVEYAVARGVNFFDVAPAYGNGRAESNLGKALGDVLRDRNDIVVGTKIALQYDDLTDVLGACERELTASLGRLGLNEISILQVHNHVGLETDEDVAEAPGPMLGLEHVLGADGVLDAIETLRKKGLVKSTAFTTFGGQRRAICEIIDSGRADAMDIELNALSPGAVYDCSRCLGRYLDCDHETIIERAVGRGMGVFGIRPLGGGSRADRSAGGSVQSHIDGLVESGQVATFAEGALRFAMNAPGISSVVLGIRTPGHVESAVAAAGLGGLPGLRYA